MTNREEKTGPGVLNEWGRGGQVAFPFLPFWLLGPDGETGLRKASSE